MEYQSSYASKQRRGGIYMINEDKNNKVNFGKSGAAPIYNGTAG